MYSLNWLQEVESNTLALAYETNELPLLYPAILNI